MTSATYIGLLAAACTTIAYMPQAVKTIKSKHTKDLSLGMYVVLNLGILAWLIYGIMINDLPITIANGISIIFTGIILSLKLKHG